MSPAEKMDEIANTLKRLAAYRVSWDSTMGPEERAHLDDIDIPRALTLARELRESAVEGWVMPDNGSRLRLFWYDENMLSTSAALLIVSDPTP